MFSYKWAAAIDQPDYSLWMQLYMERVAFFTIITPKEHTPPTDKSEHLTSGECKEG